MSTPNDKSVRTKLGNMLRRGKKNSGSALVPESASLSKESTRDDVMNESIPQSEPVVAIEVPKPPENAALVPENGPEPSVVAPIEVETPTVVPPVLEPETRVSIKRPETPPTVEYVKLKGDSMRSSLNEKSKNVSATSLPSHDGGEEVPNETKFEFFEPPPSISMRVIVRIRPLSEAERENRANAQKFVQANADGKTIQIAQPDNRIIAVSFDRVFSPACSQPDFFNESGVKEMISQALQGYAATIFAFGQTGSGKTFSITGPTENGQFQNKGLIPRAIEHLYEKVENLKSSGKASNVRIQASYIEIYNENVYDLLNNNSATLAVRWTADRGFFVENLLIVDCVVPDDALAVLAEGVRNRTTASHALNMHSSRSHSLLTIYLEIKDFKGAVGNTQNRYGKICFVDLAGSERANVVKADMETFKESLSINTALLALGLCISALADPKRRGHVPYRDSKLTKLLADSLSGRGSTMMIACVAPSQENVNETLKTLRYATQAQKIQSKPVIQLDPIEEKLLNLKTEIVILKKENIMLREILIKEGKYENELSEIAKSATSAKSLIMPQIASGSKTATDYSDSPVLNRRSATTNLRSSTATRLRSSTNTFRSGGRGASPSPLRDTKRSASPSAADAIILPKISPLSVKPKPLTKKDTRSKSRSPSRTTTLDRDTPVQEYNISERIQGLQKSTTPAGQEEPTLKRSQSTKYKPAAAGTGSAPLARPMTAKSIKQANDFDINFSSDTQHKKASSANNAARPATTQGLPTSNELIAKPNLAKKKSALKGGKAGNVWSRPPDIVVRQKKGFERRPVGPEMQPRTDSEIFPTEPEIKPPNTENSTELVSNT